MIKLLKPINPYTAWSILVEKNQCLMAKGRHGTKQSLIDKAKKAFDNFERADKKEKARTVLILATRIRERSYSEKRLMIEVFKAIVDGQDKDFYSWRKIHNTYNRRA